MSDVIVHQIRMTSRNTPAPYVVTQSSIYGSTDNITGSYPGWCIFSNSIKTSVPNECWAPTQGVLTGWVMIDLGSPKPLSVYTMRVRGDLSGFPYNSMASAWLLKGSNDGVNFTTIDQRSGIRNWSASVPEQTFVLEKDVSYRYYRIEVTANSGYSGYMTIGRMTLGYIPKFSAFYNPNTDKYFVVKNNALVEIDGSPESITSEGMSTGTYIDVTTLPDFENLIGVQGAVITHSSVPPAILLDRKVTARENLVSNPVFLSGVSSLNKLTINSTGGVLHTVSVDNGSRWLYFSGGSWVEAINDDQGMSSSVANALTAEQLSMLKTPDVNSISFKHSFTENASIASVTLTATMEGTLSLANGFTQSYDPSTRIVTFRVTTAGKYKINYVDTD